MFNKETLIEMKHKLRILTFTKNCLILLGHIDSLLLIRLALLILLLLKYLIVWEIPSKHR